MIDNRYIIDEVTSGNMHSVSSNAVNKAIIYRRTFDNRDLGWYDQDIKTAIERITEFYNNNPTERKNELDGRTVICHDFHSGSGSGCCILTDNGKPYFVGLYFTWYEPNIYLWTTNQAGIRSFYKFSGSPA